jgi:hypothetical protein
MCSTVYRVSPAILDVKTAFGHGLFQVVSSAQGVTPVRMSRCGQQVAS